MQTGGVGDRTAHLPISGQPPLSHGCLSLQIEIVLNKYSVYSCLGNVWYQAALRNDFAFYDMSLTKEAVDSGLRATDRNRSHKVVPGFIPASGIEVSETIMGKRNECNCTITNATVMNGPRCKQGRMRHR